MQTTSIQGSSYIATFIDDHLRYAVIYFLKSKDQFVQALKKFLVWGETQTSLKLRMLHLDRGGEYIAGTVTELLSEKGIERHLTMPGSPQQNGKAERFNRTVMDKAMAMLHAAGLSPGFWECAVQTAQHIYNRSPTRTLSWHTPYKLWNCGQVPDVSHLRVFGCKGYMHVPADKRHKLDAKAVEVMLVGYEAGAKGYQLWDKHTHSLRLSRDVTFDESSFLYLQSVEPHSVPVSSAPSSAQAPIIPSPDTAAPNPAAVPPPVLPVAQAPTPDSPTDSEDSVRNLLHPTTEPTESERPSERPHTPPTPSTPLSALTTLPSTPERPSATLSTPPPRRSATRVVNRPPSPLANPPEGYVDRMQHAQFLCEMANVPRRSAHAPGPNPCYFSADNVAQRGQWLGYTELLAVAHVGRDPATYVEAMRTADADDWTKACQYEMDALAKNATWELVDLPPGRKAVKNKWVFKLKSDGRYRARLVAKGFTQIPGIDFNETFSPVAHFESLRLLLALAALEDWHVHQMDVKSAFLNGMLEEEIYMEQPQGFIMSGQETRVCRLKKALYGLKQASRAWNLQFHGVLTGLGFTWTHADAGVYVHHQHGEEGIQIVILYVDDITLLGISLENIKHTKDLLSARYDMSDMGEIQSYLGIRIVRDRAEWCIQIDQSGYIADILTRFRMADANSHDALLSSV